MNEITVQEKPGNALVQLKQEAIQIAQSGVVKQNVEAIIAILLQAKVMGIAPEKALNGLFYFVNGRVGMSAEFMAYLVRSAGHSITKDPLSTDTKCILQGKRRDNGDTWSVSFSIEDAKRAGIWKENGPWAKYPSVMCYNRAMSMLFRQLFPDLSQGAGYVKEELEEMKPETLPESEVKIEEETISQAQHVNIAELLGDDIDFKNVLLDRIKRNFNCSSFLTLPVSQYENIIRIIKKHNEERLKKEMENKGE